MVRRCVVGCRGGPVVPTEVPALVPRILLTCTIWLSLVLESFPVLDFDIALAENLPCAPSPAIGIDFVYLI